MEKIKRIQERRDEEITRVSKKMGIVKTKMKESPAEILIPWDHREASGHIDAEGLAYFGSCIPKIRKRSCIYESAQSPSLPIVRRHIEIIYSYISAWRKCPCGQSGFKKSPVSNAVKFFEGERFLEVAERELLKDRGIRKSDPIVLYFLNIGKVYGEFGFKGVIKLHPGNHIEPTQKNIAPFQIWKGTV